MEKKKHISLFISFIILISTIIFVYIGIFYGAGKGQVGIDMRGTNYLKAFTVESNILGGIVSLFSIFYLLKNKNKKKYFSRWLVTLQLIASSVLSLTFLVVVFFLGFQTARNGGSYFDMFKGDMFFFHLVNPLLMVILFFINRGLYKLNNKDIYISMIPLFLYVICYVLGVLVFNNWYDIYGFLFNGKYYMTIISVVVIMVLYFGINKFFVKVYNKK